MSMKEITPGSATPAVIDKTVEKDSRVSSLAGTSDGERGLTGDAQEPKPCRDAESEPAYPSGWEVALTMTCILSAIFLMSLDRTIVATAIPRMVDEFHSLNDVGWYGSAYMLTTTCFQLLWGRIYSFYPTKFVFLTVLAFFEIGSAICGAAPSSIAFIFGRAIAGIGSAGILSGAIVLMMQAVSLPKRPLYNGFFSVVLGTSSVVGPILGGAFTSHASWRWCFYINLPIGGVAMVIILLTLKASPPMEPGLTVRQQLAKLDLLGELFLLPSLVCLLLALQWGGTTHAWTSWRIILLFVLFGACLIAFIVVQILTQKTATIKLIVISNRTVVSAMWYMFCLASTMILFTYYLPFWLQAIKGKSPVQSGVATLPFVLSLVVGSTLSGQLVGWLGYYTPFTMVSSCFITIGAGLISTFTTYTGSGMWIGYQILLGFGVGLGLQHGPIAVQTVLPHKEIPMGVALVFFCQQLGGAIIVSVGQNVLNTKLIAGITGIVDNLDRQKIIDAGATRLRDVVPAADMPAVLEKYNLALRWVYTVGTIMAALSALGSFTLEWRSVKDGKGPAAPQEDGAGKKHRSTQK